jgi:hypothetical protein
VQNGIKDFLNGKDSILMAMPNLTKKFLSMLPVLNP